MTTSNGTRIQLNNGIPKAFQALLKMSEEVAGAGDRSGVDPVLMELVKIRASQLNGCAFCLDMHTADAVKLGVDPRRLFLLDAWRETALYTEQERSALELTEAITQLPRTQDVPDDVYERAMKVFTEDQYQAVGWMIMVINSFNRLAVPGRPPLPQSS
ncbi:carboxymuconolactone decarboxylase family protein [Pseudonocardia eucalypti]|uniref:Carboxymuconolactone decarboxylase family protein n=1 Tax=Pseudonocardia eucalypti TaxID=648755 RepID=A0ABP9QKY4_9PSEU|nr:AhpD family alkylhydroperoxidase [Pseudonocardia eucalypti]